MQSAFVFHDSVPRRGGCRGREAARETAGEIAREITGVRVDNFHIDPAAILIYQAEEAV